MADRWLGCVWQAWESFEQFQMRVLELLHDERSASISVTEVAQKLGEEAIETVIAVINKDRQATISESADLIYHMLVAWADAGIHPKDIMAELSDREGISGLTVKRARNK